MKLGFHYHIPAINNQGAIFTMGLLGVFLESLADNCEELVCFQHSPTIQELKLMDFEIKAKNVTLVDLGPHASVPHRLLRFSRIKKVLIPYREQIDALLLRGPSPLLPNIASVFSETPLALLIVGDYTTNIDNLPQPWIRKEAIRLWSYINKHLQRKVIRKNLTIVNNNLLYEEYRPIAPKIIKTRTTTLRIEDSFERKDTCQKPPFHLLYAGRLDRAKGLADMIDAVDILLKEYNKDVVLDLVGWANKNDLIVTELKEMIQRLGIQDRVIFHGYKSVGPDLFRYYMRADVYLIASRGSEGFPRTIWEAMAHSVPVIATNIDSIVGEVGNAVLVVEPSSPRDLAKAINKLIETPGLRQELIMEGWDLANRNTIDFHTELMVSEIENWINIHKQL